MLCKEVHLIIHSWFNECQRQFWILEVSLILSDSDLFFIEHTRQIKTSFLIFWLFLIIYITLYYIVWSGFSRTTNVNTEILFRFQRWDLVPGLLCPGNGHGICPMGRTSIWQHFAGQGRRLSLLDVANLDTKTNSIHGKSTVDIKNNSSRVQKPVPVGLSFLFQVPVFRNHNFFFFQRLPRSTSQACHVIANSEELPTIPSELSAQVRSSFLGVSMCFELFFVFVCLYLNCWFVGKLRAATV